jgi:hypothetical protein
MAAAASPSLLLRISCAPRLSVIIGAFLRSMSCTTCDEVMASTGASPRTVTVSVKFAIDSPTLASTVRTPAASVTLMTRVW